MNKVVRGKSVEVQFTLKYKDTGTAIDLTSVTEITVLVRDKIKLDTLFEKTKTAGEIRVVTAVSGICSMYVNGVDTEDALRGEYEYIATIDTPNEYFDDSDADFAGYGDIFELV